MKQDVKQEGGCDMDGERVLDEKATEIDLFAEPTEESQTDDKATVAEPTVAEPTVAEPTEVNVPDAQTDGGASSESTEEDHQVPQPPQDPQDPQDPQPPVLPDLPQGSMSLGEMRFGITCTGEPIGTSHWLSDSSVCGDMVMALPSSVMIAGRSKEAGGVAVDMNMFLDSVIEGAGRLAGLAGISEAASLPAWAVSRLMGTFPALMSVYHEAVDQSILMVEAAAIKAAIGMKLTNTRKVVKTDEDGRKSSTSETLEREIMPDPALSKFLLTNRMKSRYKDTEDVKQAVQINVYGPEADL